MNTNRESNGDQKIDQLRDSIRGLDNDPSARDISIGDTDLPGEPETMPDLWDDEDDEPIEKSKDSKSDNRTDKKKAQDTDDTETDEDDLDDQPEPEKAKQSDPKKKQKDPEKTADKTTKADKEADRQKSVLAEFDKKQKEAKAWFDQQNAELQRQREELENARKNPPDPRDQYSDKDIEAHIKKLEENGQETDAEGLKDYLKERKIRDKVKGEFEARQKNPPEFKVEREKYVKEAYEQYPELKDVDSEHSKTLEEIWNDPKWNTLINQHPSNVPLAVRGARLLSDNRKMTARLSDLEKTNQTQQKEIERLTKLTNVNGNRTSSRPAKSGDLSRAEKRQDFRNKFAEAEASE